MSMMPIDLKDVEHFPRSFSSSPFIQPTNVSISCNLTFHNKTTRQVFLSIEERRLSSLVTPILTQKISLNPLETKVVTVLFQLLKIKSNSNLDSPLKFQPHLQRELHIHSTSNGYIDCISAVPTSLQHSKFSFSLSEQHLPSLSKDKFISVESK